MIGPLHVVSAAFTVVTLLLPLPAHAADRVLRGIQVTLNHLGFDAGEPDGANGPTTRAAIDAWYSQSGVARHNDPLELLRALQQESVKEVAAALAGKGEAPDVAAIVPHTVGTGRGFAVSPDGKLIAAYGAGVRLLNADTGRLLRTLGNCHSGVPAKFTPDSRFVAAGCYNTSSISLYDVETGRLVRGPMAMTGDVASQSVSPDGRLLAIADGNGKVGIWDLLTGQQLHLLSAMADNYPVRAVVFSPLGDALVSCGIHSGLTIWNPVTGRRTGMLQNSDSTCEAMAFSTDGHTLYAATTSGGAGYYVRPWNFDTGRAGAALEPRSEKLISALETSSDNHWVAATGWDQTVNLWTGSGEFHGNLEGFEKWVGSVAFVSPFELIASDGPVTMQWDFVADVASRTSFNDQATAQQLQVDPSGQLMTFLAADSKSVWDFASLELRDFNTLLEPISRLVQYPADRSRYLARNDGAPGDESQIARLVESDTNRVIATLEHGDFVAQALFSPDGEIAVTTSWDGNIRFWNGRTGELLNIVEAAVKQAAVFPDGQRLVTTDADGNGSIWAVPTGEKLGSFATLDATHLTVSPDGRTFVTNSKKALQFFDGDNLQRTGSFEAPAQANANFGSPRFDAGTGVVRILVGSQIHAWNTESGELIETLPVDADITSATAIPNSGMLLASSRNSGTWLIDANSGAKRIGMFQFRGGEWVLMTPDGFFDASEHGAENLNVVRGLEFVSSDSIFQALYRPDLVREALRGDPDGRVEAATALLDLNTVIASGGAPLVTIASPAAEIDVEADVIDVTARIIDRGGGIGRVEWRVNGVTLGINGRGFDRLQQDGPQAPIVAGARDVVQTLSLDPGPNLIEVVAYNASDLIASEPVSISVNWTGASAAAPPRLFVLSVGVNDYWDSRLQLNYAASDATAIAKAFEQAGAGLYETVETKVLLDDAVTLAGLDAAFADLSQKVRPRDVFVLFMAGHGQTEQGRYYFLPQDFRYENAASVASSGIDQEQFQEWLATIAARKSVLLYDTCESGTLTAEGTLTVATRGLEEVAALERMTRAMGRTVLSASTDTTPALEGYQGHGIFTYALLTALGQGDADADGAIAVTELASVVDREVPALSYQAFRFRQVPQMSIQGSDFPLALSANVFPATAAPQVAAEAPVGAARPEESEPAATMTGEPADAVTAVSPAARHVVVAEATVRSAPEGNAAPVQTLEPGVVVEVLGASAQWRWIARDGEPLGFVDAAQLIQLR